MTKAPILSLFLGGKQAWIIMVDLIPTVQVVFIDQTKQERLKSTL